LILLDTHAILWWVTNPAKLSAVATKEIGRADAILVSPLSCWEVAILQRRGRLRLDREILEWVRDLFATDRIEPAALTSTAAVAAETLGEGFPNDPIDRLLYATARERGVSFITKDRGIRSFARGRGDVRAIW
jgi:PIN domain nuclease of toxin-antitoxin system